jgi:hypothetical protein
MWTDLLLGAVIKGVSSSASQHNAATPAEQFPYDLAVALITLLVAPMVADRATAYWTRRQKRRELDTAAATELYALYGEFLAIWKLRNLRDSEVLGPREPRVAAILERTTRMEGRFESLLLAAVAGHGSPHSIGGAHQHAVRGGSAVWSFGGALSRWSATVGPGTGSRNRGEQHGQGRGDHGTPAYDCPG